MGHGSWLHVFEDFDVEVVGWFLAIVIVLGIQLLIITAISYYLLVGDGTSFAGNSEIGSISRNDSMIPKQTTITNRSGVSSQISSPSSEKSKKISIFGKRSPPPPSSEPQRSRDSIFLPNGVKLTDLLEAELVTENVVKKMETEEMGESDLMVNQMVALAIYGKLPISAVMETDSKKVYKEVFKM